MSVSTRPLSSVIAVVGHLNLVSRVLFGCRGLSILSVHHFDVVGRVVYVGLIMCHQVYVLLLGHESTS